MSHGYRPPVLATLSLLLFVGICLTGCREKEESPEPAPLPLADFGPSRELQIAMQNLAVLGFVPAPKIEKEDYHYHQHLITIQNQPFFIVDAKQHWFLGRNEQYAALMEKGTLGKVKNAWGYFVQTEDDKAMKPDAMVEEWQFETPKEAFDAFKEIGNLLNSRHIKEPSYSLQHDNRVYLLYTRAHAFQGELDKIYEMLKSQL